MAKKINLTKMIFMIVMYICVLASTDSVFAANTNVMIYIDGAKQTIPAGMGKSFVDTQNRTQVPVRFISEALGHEVLWNEKKQTATIDGTIGLTINNKVVKTAKGSITMDTVPFVKDNRTYVPLRFVSEALGYRVDYKNGCVLIYTSDASTSTTQPTTNTSKPSTGGNTTVSGVNSYDWSDYPSLVTDQNKIYISSEKIGSNSNNTTTRAAGTSWDAERTYLNSLAASSGWGLAKDGQLTIGAPEDVANRQIGSSDTALIIGVSNGQRQVGIRGWITKANTNPERDPIVWQNIIMESLKYYANTTSDGIQIYKYLDDHFSAYDDPPYDQPMTFGSTKVTFLDPGQFGVSVCFDAK